MLEILKYALRGGVANHGIHPVEPRRRKWRWHDSERLGRGEHEHLFMGAIRKGRDSERVGEAIGGCGEMDNHRPSDEHASCRERSVLPDIGGQRHIAGEVTSKHERRYIHRNEGWRPFERCGAKRLDNVHLHVAAAGGV